MLFSVKVTIFIGFRGNAQLPCKLGQSQQGVLKFSRIQITMFSVCSLQTNASKKHVQRCLYG